MSNLKEKNIPSTISQRKYASYCEFTEILVLAGVVNNRKIADILVQLKPVVNKELNELKREKQKLTREHNKKRNTHELLLESIKNKIGIEEKIKMQCKLELLEKELAESNRLILELTERIKTMQITISSLEKELEETRSKIPVKPSINDKYDMQILELRNLGLSEAKIARELGGVISRSSVHNRLDN